MASVGDPDALDRFAASYDRSADLVADVGGQHRRWFDASSWQGPRADGMRSLAAERERSCRTAADELHWLASRFRQLAGTVRARQRYLLDLQRRIDLWATAHPPGTDPGRDAGLIRWRPPPADDDWEELAGSLRAAGAVF